VTLLLDAGAFIAAERGDRDMVVRVKSERLAGRTARTHGGVVAQIWRGGPRQARVARLLGLVEIVALDDPLGRATGLLLGINGTSDVVDAALVSMAQAGDIVLTSDTDDLVALARSASADLEIVAV
jgi:hypothetical protein